MCPPHTSWPASRPACKSPWISFPVTASKCSYAPGLSRISRVFMPATMAKGLPDKVPAWYMGPGQISCPSFKNYLWPRPAMCAHNHCPSKLYIAAISVVTLKFNLRVSQARNASRSSASLASSKLVNRNRNKMEWLTCWSNHLHDLLAASISTHRQSASNHLAQLQKLAKLSQNSEQNGLQQHSRR